MGRDRSRSRSRSRDKGSRGERIRGESEKVRGDRESRHGRDRDDEKSGRKRSSRSPIRRHFREDNEKNDSTKDKDMKQAVDKDKSDKRRNDDSLAKPSKEELRRNEAAAKRLRMREEAQRKKDKVKDRMDLIRQMKGDASGEEDALGSGSDDDGDDDGDLTEEQQMMKMMGFSGFDSSKGKEVEDNKRGPAKGGFSKHKEREYRQYMNRRGGFNRPLDKI